VAENKKIEKTKENQEKNGKIQIWVKKEKIEYEKELRKLQVELLKFQNHVKDKGLKILMIWKRWNYQANYRASQPKRCKSSGTRKTE